MVKKWLRTGSPGPKRRAALPVFFRRLKSFIRRLVGLPPTAWEWSRRAREAFKQKDFEAAIEYATLAIARDHESDGHYIRACALTWQGNWTQALEDLNAVVRLLPNWATGWNDRGRANFELSRFEEAIADFNRAINCDHRDADLFINRAEAHVAAGNQTAALADWDSALQIDPKCIDVYRSRAYWHLAEDRMAEALAESERLIKLSPHSQTGYLTRGAVHYHSENYQQAMEDLTKAIDLRVDVPFVWRARGHCWYGLKNIRQAIDDTNECLKRSPKDGIAFSNRGLFLSKAGDYSRAVADLHKAMEVAPSLPNSYMHLAWIQATSPDAAFRDGEQAVANASQGWKLSKQEDRWLAFLAAAHAEEGNFEEAIGYQQRYLQSAKDDERAAATERLSLYEKRLPFREAAYSCATVL